MGFKRPLTKTELRKQLQDEIDNFLHTGGEVKQVAKGLSGRTDALPVKKVFFDDKKESRTYVTELVAEIDARRTPTTKPSHSKAKKPKQKIVYDDFGEPVRKVWVEE